jgi:DNA-binding MarR family transcriptional regulator
VSTEEADGGSPAHQPGASVPVRVGFLLKHAQLGYADLAADALAPYGIDGRELAVLTLLAGQDLLSQQELAHDLGIDRTTMVALIDGLETKNLVERRPHPSDRRKNIVELTAVGRRTLADATRAADDAERRFLGPLGEEGARQFKAALRALLGR